jgi:hypothetical protein
MTERPWWLRWDGLPPSSSSPLPEGTWFFLGAFPISPETRWWHWLIAAVIVFSIVGLVVAFAP